MYFLYPFSCYWNLGFFFPPLIYIKNIGKNIDIQVSIAITVFCLVYLFLFGFYLLGIILTVVKWNVLALSIFTITLLLSSEIQADFPYVILVVLIVSLF